MVALLAVLVGSGPTAAAPSSAETRESYIVVFRDFLGDGLLTDELQRAEGFTTTFRYTAALNGFAALLTATQAAHLAQHPLVAIVSRDQTVHAVGPEPLSVAEIPTGVRRMEAATDTAAATASTTAVAVIDTGVDLTHPDLKVRHGTNCVSPGSSSDDDNGHGSHVGGSIAALNDSAGVVGVAPGTTLYSVKVLSSTGSGTWSQVICGIDWVTANADELGIRVANLSLGGSGTTNYSCGESALHKAICNSTAAGITYVVAAGNSGGDLYYQVPGNYPEVLTVTAMSDSDGRPGAVGGSPTCRSGELDDSYASFSNYADIRYPADVAHTIAGPGVCIRSTWKDGGYAVISGTSMATPHVAALVALCIGSALGPGACAGRTPAQIISQMRSEAEAYSSANAGYGFWGDPLRRVNNRYYGYLVSAKAYVPTAPDETSPVIGDLTATDMTTSGATISWTTDEPADSLVEYRAASEADFRTTPVSDTGGVTAHSVTLSGLEPETAYEYRVTSVDAAGNSATSGVQTFTTAPVDLTAPAITAEPSAGSITASGATISWTTDEVSDSQVGYGTASGSYTWTAASQTGVTSHSVALSGLTASTVYYYVARSTDAAGNAVTSAERTFTTAASTDTTAPSISDVRVRDRTSTSARITWTTNEPADSQVQYGRTTSYGSWSPLDTLLVTSHSITLTGLEPDRRYYFRVWSRDAAGNISHSSRYSFRTRDD